MKGKVQTTVAKEISIDNFFKKILWNSFKQLFIYAELHENTWYPLHSDIFIVFLTYINDCLIDRISQYLLKSCKRAEFWD